MFNFNFNFIILLFYTLKMTQNGVETSGD